MQMNNRWILIGLSVFLFWLPPWLAAEAGVLNSYIEAGLQNNLALQQEEFSLQQSLSALKEARGMFGPSISIEARYTLAGGGRVIEFPVGDLVNPIHRTLNQLLAVQGQSPPFPGDLANEVIPFLRRQEHETKLRVVQPLFQPALYYNARIKDHQSGVQRAGLAAFKRQLVLDIKVAYANYLKAVRVEGALQSTRELLQENLRISRSLFDNNKVTREVVLRSVAELSGLEQQIEEAGKNVVMAASYFNFLINRPLEADIEVDRRCLEELEESPRRSLSEYQAQAMDHREEFRQLEQAIEAVRSGEKLQRSRWLPGVTAVLDYGFQGENYSFTGRDDFWTASLVMSWNLFRGGQDRAKRHQAVLERRRLEARMTELENRIRLGVREAYYGLQVARSAVESAEKKRQSREAAFRIVARKYEQGMVPQVEYIQARNDFTHAEIEYIVARYDRFIQAARLERSAAAAKI